MQNYDVYSKISQYSLCVNLRNHPQVVFLGENVGSPYITDQSSTSVYIGTIAWMLGRPSPEPFKGQSADSDKHWQWLCVCVCRYCY